MQRLADEVGASVGSVYTYFPSKGALVAEVQREAIERLAASALVLGADVDRAVHDLADDVAALAPVVVASGGSGSPRRPPTPRRCSCCCSCSPT